MLCTRDTLVKHIQRAVYHAAIWQKALNAMIECPHIANYGWLVDEDGNVSINWMDLRPAPDGILENIECYCKKGCASNRCSSVNANLLCTSLCKCIGCSNGKENSCNEFSDSEDGSESVNDNKCDNK